MKRRICCFVWLFLLLGTVAAQEKVVKLKIVQTSDIHGNYYPHDFILQQVWGIERSGFFNGREKWAKGFENQRV